MRDTLIWILSWVPLILLLSLPAVLYILINRYARPPISRTASGLTVLDLHAQQIEETRRTNAVLERIVAALEKRQSA